MKLTKTLKTFLLGVSLPLLLIADFSREAPLGLALPREIGRASCRERV